MNLLVCEICGILMIDSHPCLCYPSARRMLVSSRYMYDEGGSRWLSVSFFVDCPM